MKVKKLGVSGDLKSGLKAGVLSGVIFGLIFDLLILPLIINIWYWVIGIEFRLPPPFFNMEILVRTFTIGGAIFGGIGVVIGLVFSVLHDDLPGGTPVRKGMILAVVSWFAVDLATKLIYSNLEGFFDLVNIMNGASWALFGLMLGYFWDRFGSDARGTPEEAKRLEEKVDGDLEGV